MVERVLHVRRRPQRRDVLSPESRASTAAGRVVGAVPVPIPAPFAVPGRVPDATAGPPGADRFSRIQRSTAPLTMDAGGNDEAVIRRKIDDNPDPPPNFVSDSDRPKWQAHADRSLLSDYNAQYGTSVAKVPYVANNLDRAHILSFQDIESQLLGFLNGDVSDSDFTKWYYTFTASITDTKERANVDKAASAMTSSRTARAANTLLGRLNSLSQNLRPASGTINSYIGEHPDLRGNYSPGGHWHATDASRIGQYLSQNPMLLTPQHQSRMMTSEGPVPLNMVSPRMQSQLQGQGWESRGVHSASTIGALYPGSTASSFPGGKSGSFNFSGVNAAPADLAALWYEYGMLKKNAARDPNQEKRFQELLGIMTSVGWPT